MAYIDPGTGSLLFSILISMVGTGYYFLQNAKVNTGLFLSGRKQADMNAGTSIPLVIYSDSKRYWNLFEPICGELEKRGQETVYYTASSDDPALKKQYEHIHCEFIGDGNKSFVKMNCLSADIVLSTTPGLDVLQWQRSRNVKTYVHILHMVTDPASYRMFGLDYYDAVLLSGNYQISQIRELEQTRGLPAKELAVVGMPYMDRLKQRYENEGKGTHCDSASPTILLAPSWGKSSILNRYGSAFIRELLDTGYHIVIRPHPQSFTAEKELIDKLMQEFPESDQLEWNRDTDNFDILSRSDLLISDFSGVIFDFTFVFRRPVICADTSFDTAPYDACWLKKPMWMFDVLPRLSKPLTAENARCIKELIDETINDHSFEQNLDAIIQESWANIGQSASVTADYLIQKLQELKEIKTDTEA